MMFQHDLMMFRHIIRMFHHDTIMCYHYISMFHHNIIVRSYTSMLWNCVIITSKFTSSQIFGPQPSSCEEDKSDYIHVLTMSEVNKLVYNVCVIFTSFSNHYIDVYTNDIYHCSGHFEIA